MGWSVSREAVGVYAIRHILTGLLYIGSSENSIYNRSSHHRTFLKQNKHGSKKLQELWNKDGQDAFELLVLEECNKENCREREQFWMNKHRDQLLNGTPNVDGTGRKMSPETIEKMRISAQERVKRPEYIAKLSARVKRQHKSKKFGQHVWAEDTKERVSSISVRPRGSW